VLLAETFADDLAARGRCVAVVTPDGVLTYADLHRRVEDVACRLGPVRCLVALEAANTVEALVAYLAALRRRHAVMLLPPGNDAAGQRLVDLYDADIVMRTASGWEPDARRQGSVHELHPDLALLLSTSGSTGSAKLVRLSRANLQTNAEAIGTYLGLSSADRAATTLPMAYCYGLSIINSHLAAGASLVLTDRSVVDRCFWELFRAADVTSLAGVPHTFELLDRVGFERMSLPSLRYVTQAGGRLAPERVRRYATLARRGGWQFFVMYGQTEATARMAYLPPALAGRHPESVGLAIPGGAFRLDPVDGLDAAGGTVGELVYSGPNVMLGYAESPHDLALGRTVEELRTGDVARRTAGGMYEVIGRRSRFVKPGGLRIDLDEVERLVSLAGAPGLCTGDDERIVVAVQNGGRTAAIARLISDQVGLPVSRIVVAAVDELPRLPNGKPDYPAVAALRTAPPHDQTRPAARRVAATREAAIRGLYAEAAGRPVLDDESFVGARGDSLSYVEVSLGLEDVLGKAPPEWHTLPLRALLSAPAHRRRRAPTVETSVVLRAMSILLIVGSHTGVWQVRGGAHVLLAVAGFNFAQFRLGALGGLARSIARIALPSMAWIGLAAVVGDQLEWRHVLLVNHLLGGSDPRVAYWFIEALVLILVAVGAVLAIPAVRRHERRHPFRAALVVVALGLVIRFDAVVDFTAPHSSSRPENVLWLFALGWAGAVATASGQRLVVSGLAGPAVWGFWGSQPLREAVVMSGLLLLVWVPRVPVPRPLNRVLGTVASMSLVLYLTHWQVYPPLLRTFGSLAAFGGSLAVGLVIWAGGGRLRGWWPSVSPKRPRAASRSRPAPSIRPGRCGL
jgi:acyl-CoA synthetase (AMP-forming)/AMP-acid ligase II